MGLRANLGIDNMAGKSTGEEGSVAMPRDRLTIRAIVVDNHPIMRAGIRALLQTLRDVEVVGEANNGLEGIELVKSLEPDVVFMDIAMPVLSGLATTERMLTACPKVRVIILSRHEEDEYL